MTDLGSLTEGQRREHYESVCQAIGLDPKLELLQFMWLDSGAGERHLVLYALRGATDILRAKRKISVTDLTPHSGDGYISYIAKGIDDTGRTEIAVGAASIKDIKGRQLETNVMTAQTRALRRLTLQFVGGGLLDESELPGVVSDISRSGSSLASLATLPAPAVQPTAQLNPEAGKDITVGAASGKSTSDDIPESQQAATPEPVFIEQINNVRPDGYTQQQIEKVQETGFYPGHHVTLDDLKGAFDQIPTQEQKKEYKKRWNPYVEDILPNNGMKKEEGIIWKWKKYASGMFPGKPDPVDFTIGQWEQFFGTVEGIVKEQGPAGLVAVVEEFARKV